MPDQGEPRTWHHGLVATWWAEFNDDFRPDEVAYVRRFVEEGGGPALDAGCGTGRLLLPFLAEGLDVDGCDASADMLAACERKASERGLSPSLHLQPLHRLDLPRRYSTIFVVGTFGLGSDRERDAQALVRLHDHLEPGGTLLVDLEVPWGDAGHWARWPHGQREGLPEKPHEPTERRRGSDGAEYALSNRLIAVDPLKQRLTLEISARRWRDGTLDAQEEHLLDVGMYFPNEMRLMLERAGFRDITVHGGHQRRPPTAEDQDLVFIARR